MHPTLPYIFSSADDGTIRIWDFEKNFTLFKHLDDHVHYVMMLSVNPRDQYTFCSGSMDRTVKVCNNI